MTYYLLGCNDPFVITCHKIFVRKNLLNTNFCFLPLQFMTSMDHKGTLLTFEAALEPDHICGLFLGVCSIEINPFYDDMKLLVALL